MVILYGKKLHTFESYEGTMPQPGIFINDGAHILHAARHAALR